MIVSFGNKLAEDIFHAKKSKETRKFPNELIRIAERKLQYLNAAHKLGDLKVPPGNNMKKLSGSLNDKYAIRINDQWRVVFNWDANGASLVEVIDYH